jgi:hypothetical protein
MAAATANKLIDSKIFKGDARAWRDDTFLPQIATLVTDAMKQRPDGRKSFEVNPSFVSTIMNYFAEQIAFAQKEFSISSNLSSFFQDQIQTVRSIKDSVSAFAASSPSSVDAKLTQVEKNAQRQAGTSASLAKDAAALTRTPSSSPFLPAATSASTPLVLPDDKDKDKDKDKFPIVPVAAGIAALAILYLLLGDE